MFRKPKKPIAKRKKTLVDDDDNENDSNNNTEEEEVNLRQRIQQVQKKQKLLATLASQPSTKGSSSLASKTMTAATTDATTNDAESSHLSVMERKHQQAMQDYIQSQMDPQQTASAEDDNDKKATETDAPWKDLLVPTGTNASSSSEPADDMLVTGAGLAEVILPPKQHQKQQQASSDNKIRRPPRQFPNTSSAVPTSSHTAGASDTKRERVETLNLPTLTARTMLPQRTQQPSSSQDQATATTTSNDNDKDDASPEAVADQDASRMGFRAYQQASGNSNHRPYRQNTSSTQNRSSKHPHGPQRDLQVFKDFVQRQKR